MFKGRMKYVWIGVILIIGIGVMILLSPELEQWKPDFRMNSKKPYGGYILHERLRDVFPKATIHTVNKSLSAAEDDMGEEDAEQINYLMISPALELKDEDFRTLYDMVSVGNNCFIASARLPYNLQDSLGVEIVTSRYPGQLAYYDTTEIYQLHFTNPYLQPKTRYTYQQPDESLTFAFRDTTAFEVLAIDQKHNPVFVRTKIGDGYLYLHCYPLAFSNYYLLHEHNDDFAAKCLSYLPPNIPLYWDEYCKLPGGHENITGYDYVLQYGSLVGALLVTLFGMLLYTLMGMKRTQRIIPIKDEFKNTSYEFVSTIGRLYFNKADHDDLFRKKILYWREYLRSNLLIEQSAWSESFTNMVAERSGIDKEKIKAMVDHMQNVSSYGAASDEDVKKLHINLDYFYKNTKR